MRHLSRPGRSITTVFLFGAWMLAGCSTDDGKPGPGPTITGPQDAGGTDSAPGAKKANAVVGCNDDTECESGVCFHGAIQSFCTVHCTTDNAATLCVAPLTGSCNKQGYCKRD